MSIAIREIEQPDKEIVGLVEESIGEIPKDFLASVEAIIARSRWQILRLTQDTLDQKDLQKEQRALVREITQFVIQQAHAYLAAYYALSYCRTGEYQKPPVRLSFHANNLDEAENLKSMLKIINRGDGHVATSQSDGNSYYQVSTKRTVLKEHFWKISDESRRIPLSHFCERSNQMLFLKVLFQKKLFRLQLHDKRGKPQIQLISTAKFSAEFWEDFRLLCADLNLFPTRSEKFVSFSRPQDIRFLYKNNLLPATKTQAIPTELWQTYGARPKKCAIDIFLALSKIMPNGKKTINQNELANQTETPISTIRSWTHYQDGTLALRAEKIQQCEAERFQDFVLPMRSLTNSRLMRRRLLDYLGDDLLTQMEMITTTYAPNTSPPIGVPQRSTLLSRLVTARTNADHSIRQQINQFITNYLFLEEKRAQEQALKIRIFELHGQSMSIPAITIMLKREGFQITGKEITHWIKEAKQD
jgi:hypothetical protein